MPSKFSNPKITKLIEKIFIRISMIGFLSTLSYLFVTVFLEKLGIEINYLFKTTLPSKAACQDDVIVLYSMADLDICWQDSFRKKYKIDPDDYFKNHFSRNNILALGLVRENPVSLSWLSCVPCGHEFLNTGDWLIHSCLTFSEARGLGFYPRSICALEQVAFDLWQSGKGSKFLYMECSIANKASIKGIKKAGLVKSLLLVKMRGRVFLRWSYV